MFLLGRIISSVRNISACLMLQFLYKFLSPITTTTFYKHTHSLAVYGDYYQSSSRFQPRLKDGPSSPRTAINPNWTTLFIKWIVSLYHVYNGSILTPLKQNSFCTCFNELFNHLMCPNFTYLVIITDKNLGTTMIWEKSVS